MKLLIVFVVAVGVCSASPAGFLQNTPEVQAATIQFINEYNRLARLAAEAPDIHIYHADPRRLQQINAIPVAQKPRRVAAQVPQASNIYSFTANLGANRQFQPHQFRNVHTQHAAHTNRRVHVAPTVQQPQYRGPFADTVPAGLHGAPVPVSYTPEVQAARDAHFNAVAQAYQRLGIVG